VRAPRDAARSFSESSTSIFDEAREADAAEGAFNDGQRVDAIGGWFPLLMRRAAPVAAGSRHAHLEWPQA
jgi:hypothetical protein